MFEDFPLDWIIKKLLGGKPEDEYRRTSPLKAAIIVGGVTAFVVILTLWLALGT